MRQSRLFAKTTKTVPADEKSVNARLLIRAGYIDKTTAGVYSYLPLGWRVLNRIANVIREEINAIGGQEILMPALQPKELWEQTKRWEGFDVLFKLQGHGDKEYALGSTHEEVVTPLVKQFVQSYKDLPVYAYQIQTKFRNEARAKSGVLRGREFLMKDLYSFHADEADLERYYATVQGAYKKIYDRLGLGDRTHLTFASGGAFSKYSHEYQTLTESGEDIIFVCAKCEAAVNKEIVDGEQKGKPECVSCGGKEMREEKSIEVGNIFQLKTKFTDAFHMGYTGADGEKHSVLMGCYGIGVSRLLGAIVEVFHDDRGILWPRSAAPFPIHLLALGNEERVRRASDGLYEDLEKAGMEILYDDRDASAGEKFADADLIGIPLRVVVSEKTLQKKSVEVKNRGEGGVEFLPVKKAVKTLAERM